jgi:hypothetical protein
MREPSVVIPVTKVVDDDGLVHIEGDDLSLVLGNHRPALLHAALQRFCGMADWKPRWHLLAVATEAFIRSARSVFNLAALGERRECYIVRSTNPNHLVPSAPCPTNVSPLRIGAGYAAGGLGFGAADNSRGTDCRITRRGLAWSLAQPRCSLTRYNTAAATTADPTMRSWSINFPT